MRIHRNGGCNYASTQSIVVDAERESGRNKLVRKHLGIGDDNNVFHPNNALIMLSPDERSKYIFPEDWDMSEVNKLPSTRKVVRPSSTAEDSNLLYGDTWLLEQIVDKTGLKEDLIKALDGTQGEGRCNSHHRNVSSFKRRVFHYFISTDIINSNSSFVR